MSKFSIPCIDLESKRIIPYGISVKILTRNLSQITIRWCYPSFILKSFYGTVPVPRFLLNIWENNLFMRCTILSLFLRSSIYHKGVRIWWLGMVICYTFLYNQYWPYSNVNIFSKTYRIIFNRMSHFCFLLWSIQVTSILLILIFKKYDISSRERYRYHTVRYRAMKKEFHFFFLMQELRYWYGTRYRTVGTSTIALFSTLRYNMVVRM